MKLKFNQMLYKMKVYKKDKNNIQNSFIFAYLCYKADVSCYFMLLTDTIMSDIIYFLSNVIQ